MHISKGVLIALALCASDAAAARTESENAQNGFSSRYGNSESTASAIGSRFLAKFLPLLIHLDTQGLISVLFPLLRMHTQGLIRRLPLLLHLDTRGLISVLSLLLRPLLLRLDIQGLISVLRPLLRPQTQGLIRIHAAKPLPQKLPPMCSPVLYLLRSRVDSRA
jgi:hypothetical protein